MATGKMVIEGANNVSASQCKELFRLIEEKIINGKHIQILFDHRKVLEDETLLQLMKGVQIGTHEIKAIEHRIDCDDAPMIPKGSSLEEHQKGGMLQFDITKVNLHLHCNQKNGNIEGSKLREELKSKKVLNANVLDYLLVNPHLIPEEWKGKAVFFWGTIYRYSSGSLYVRHLYWGDTRWCWGSSWLSYTFDAHNPAAMLAN